jgi:glycogen operon protein
MPLRATAPAVSPGARAPAGATWTPKGTNFSIYSRDAAAVELLLYDTDTDAGPGAATGDPARIIALDPRQNRSFHFWHVFVPGLPVGSHYNWRITPAGAPAHPVEVLDPWARAVSGTGWERARRTADAAAPLGLRGIVVDPEFDWLRDPPPAGDLAGAVIYELHVGGFTRHPSSGVEHPGTFLGLREKIPYLKELGITHVQFLPVAAFDDQDVPPSVAALGLANYWGYSTHSFAAPHPGYCVARGQAGQADEFRQLVKALHAAGIGVILDVVYNHTAEGGAGGPVINFKQLMPSFFYHRDGEDYRDYTGCGNTVNCNHPLVTQFIIGTLERWVNEYHVDGFRFDLASVFTRGEDGEPMRNPPLPWSIEFSPPLHGRALIAEAWDAAGLYHVGSFPGLAWSEWNGRFRDVVRRAVRGDAGMLGGLATALTGSSDLYEPDGRQPRNGINFVTCHDGFTLADLVSYERKHNLPNGEDGRDGSSENLGSNHGVEGDTGDATILAIRRQQARNLLAILFLSQGVPMLLAGDEVLRTQRGNNNAWCQDNEVSWFDWRLTGRNADMLQFTRELIAFRRRHPTLWRRHFLTGRPEGGRGLPDIAWHGLALDVPAWSDPEAEAHHVLAFTLAGLAPAEEDLHVICNLGLADHVLPLPAIPGRRWHLAVDTAAASTTVIPRDAQRPVTGDAVTARSRSVVVLEAR